MSKRKPPYPVCICCLQDVPRTDEHIISAGLGGGKINNGELILKGATCALCNRRYHKAETQTIKRTFPGVAFHRGIRTRRKPGDVAVKVVIDGRLRDEIVQSGHEPGVATIPEWKEPGIFRGADRELQSFDNPEVFDYSFAPGITERMAALGTDTFYRGTEFDQFDLAQFLAKVAHCYAVKELGFDWHPYALPVALGWNAYAPYIIGTRRMRVDTSRMHFIGLATRQIGELTVYVVHVWFFTDPTDERELPVFEIVVGRPRGHRTPESHPDQTPGTSEPDHTTVPEPLYQGWPTWIPPQGRAEPDLHIGFYRADEVEFLS